jgi:large subunit ribosomal protein L15
LVKGKDILVKVLGMGDLSKKLTFDVDAISSTAKEKIEKAGGTVIQKKTEEEGKNGN